MTTAWEDFARLCTDVLREDGERRLIVQDARRDRLMVGTPPGLVSFIHLKCARNEWEDAPPFTRARVLRRRFWSSILHQAPPTQEQVLERVLPRIRDRAWFAAVRAEAELQRGADQASREEALLPHQEINEELSAHLAYELPGSLAEVGPQHLRAWGLTFERLMARAQQNLRAISQVPWDEPVAGVFVSPFHDTLDATRMLLTDVISAMAVRGRPVFLAPNHDVAFVTGDEDAEGLEQVATWAEEALLEPRAHTAIAFRLVDGVYQQWLPPKGHSAFHKMRLLALQSLAFAYARQKELLEAHQQACGQSVAVEALRAFRGASGEILTTTHWQEGLEALIPQADRIDFVRVREFVPRVWSTPFARAREIVGQLMLPTQEVPPRWRVKEFPSESQLEEMALAEEL